MNITKNEADAAACMVAPETDRQAVSSAAVADRDSKNLRALILRLDPGTRREVEGLIWEGRQRRAEEILSLADAVLEGDLMNSRACDGGFEGFDRAESEHRKIAAEQPEADLDTVTEFLEDWGMAATPSCPDCGLWDVTRWGFDSSGNQRYACDSATCDRKTFIVVAQRAGGMRLAPEKELLCRRILAEGVSIRGCERITGVHRDTISKLTEDPGGV